MITFMFGLCLIRFIYTDHRLEGGLCLIACAACAIALKVVP